MMKRTILILTIFAGAVGYFFLGHHSNDVSYDPRIAKAFIRIGVINQTYRGQQDSIAIIRAMILKEEGLNEDILLGYETYLKSNPGLFAAFLDSLEALTDSLSALSTPAMRQMIMPQDLFSK